MTKKMRTSVATLTLASGVILAGQAHAQTLEQAWVTAYGRNPQIQSERAKLRATDEQVSQALSNWRPTVQATAGASASHTKTTTSGSSGSSSFSNNSSNNNNSSGLGSSNGSTDTTPRTYQLTVSQPIWRGGRTVAQTSQAENTVQAERATLQATEQTVLLNVATSYMDVLRDQALLQLQVDNEQILREQLQASQAQNRAGTALDTDVLLAQARLSTALANRRTAEQNLATSRETYAQYVGEPPQTLVFPTQRPPLPASIEQVKALAATANPNVTAAVFTQKAAADNVDVVRGQLLPTVSLNGSAGRNVDQSVSGRTTDSYTVTAQVAVPLYEAGSVYSQTRAAQQTVTQRQRELDTQRDIQVQAAAAAWNSLVAARATITSTQEAVQAEEAAFRGIQAQYRAGLRSILDVLNEQQTLLNNRISLVTARRNEVVAEMQVVGAVGRLTALDLNLPVELYDPTRNYNTVRDKWFGFGAVSE